MTNTGIRNNNPLPERPRYNDWKGMEEKLAKAFISEQNSRTGTSDELKKIEKKRGTIV